MIRLEPAGERAAILYLGSVISEQSAARVSAAVELLQDSFGSALIDIVPSYTSILLTYDINHYNYFSFKHAVCSALSELAENPMSRSPSRIVEVPVYYGEEVALDLAEVARSTGLSGDEVIRLHSQQHYNVYAIGFAPGFAYLGLTPKELRVDRKKTPRLKVPCGSVAIADNQTAIYPSVTPGGWQIIGRTPMSLIDWQSESVSPFTVGDAVRFRAVDKETFLAQGGCLDEF
ncbi:MAG: 5-oxoprolinase subunit PxpB [Oceanospirillaceae bacterium]|nr:5-oxoprolinase subunit PxpB [Oceanospirillaceae bacterium]